MQSRTNRLTKNSLFLYIRTFIQLVIALYTSRILLSALGIDDYGIYNVIAGTVSMFAFLNSALSVSTQRFLNFELGKNDYEKVSTIFYTAKNIHKVLAFSLFIIAELAGLWFLYYKMNIPPDRVPDGFWVLQTSILVLLVNILIVPYNASIVAHEDFTAFAYIGILDVVLKLLLAIAITLLSANRLVIYAIGMFSLSFLVFVIYRCFCMRKYTEYKQKGIFDKNVFKEMFSFAGWNFLGAFSQICRSQGINILLNIFGGVAVNAAQGIANQVNAAVMQFVSNFTTALNPQIVKSYSAGDKNYFHKLIYTGSKISAMLMSLIVLPIVLEVNFILHLWLKEIPLYTSQFVILILIALIIYAWTSSISTAISASGKIKTYSLILGMINICILPVSYLFLKINWSPTIVYKIFIVANLINILFVLILAKKIIKLNIFLFLKKVILPICFIVGVSIILLFKIQSLFDASFLRLIGITLLSSFLLAVQYYFIALTKDEKLLTKRVFSKIKPNFHAYD